MEQLPSLMYVQDDNATGVNCEQVLTWVQQKNAENNLVYSNWRMPNIKELQSIVDYSHTPEATDTVNEGPAIDPLFTISTIKYEAGDSDYPYFWTSTSARFQTGKGYYYAWYVTF